MNRKYSFIILTLFTFWSNSVYSQTYCTVPLPPVLTSVTVQPETGHVELNWELSPSSGISAYLVYNYHDENGVPRGDILDTIWNPKETCYIVTSTSSKYFSSSYVVAAYRLPGTIGVSNRFGCPSIFSNVLSTIFTTAIIDTCNNKIDISWNSYRSVPKKVTNYSILISVNGVNYTEASKAGSEKTIFSISNFTTDAEYCFLLKANIEGDLSSTSNKACLITKMQHPPGWINADYATVNADNKISLAFTIDPASEITHFMLERKRLPSGTFQEIANPISLNGSVVFTDNTAKTDSINYYRLSAINNCNNPVTISNLSSNIVLSLAKSDNDLKLSWNSYKRWMGSVSSYNILINTGKGFEEKAVIQSSDTTITLGYEELMYEVTGHEVCFYISAYETSNPYGITGQSHSSRKCILPTEIITVPNIFTPNNDLINDFFKPVLSFTPVEYHLIISDRQGKILFETRDYLDEWDGTQNGKYQPERVCLWFLKVITPSGKPISRTGTLTILNNRQ